MTHRWRSRTIEEGLPDETERGGADFHSLRTSFITALAKAGVHPRVAHTLARHSDINLTMATYSEVGQTTKPRP